MVIVAVVVVSNNGDTTNSSTKLSTRESSAPSSLVKPTSSLDVCTQVPVCFRTSSQEVQKKFYFCLKKTHYEQTQNEHKLVEISIRYDKTGYYLNLTEGYKMSNAVKKIRLKKDEEKLVVSYANLKLKANRILKEVDTMKPSVVNLFDRVKQNVVFAKDSNDNIFGIQRINRKRKKFDTANFKIKHTDLYNKFTSEIEYNEYKALGDNNE